MLAKLNCRFVIVGHSERRELFGETDEMVAKKVRAVLGAGMAPVVCVGETLDERDAGTTDDQGVGPGPGRAHRPAPRRPAPLRRRLRADLGDRHRPQRHPRGRQRDNRDDPRQALDEVSAGAGPELRVLYGGSVKPGNIAELMAMPEIDGGLVGGASLDPDDFARLVRFAR